MPVLPMIAAGVSIASALGSTINSLFGKPDYALSEDEVNRLIDLQLNRTLAQESSSARRRLAASGIGGSSVVNSILADNASRIRSHFEEERSRLLQTSKQGQYAADVSAFENRGALFGNLASLGFGAYQLSQPNPFQNYLDQLRTLQNQTGNPAMTPELQSLSNRNDLQNLYWNNPYQSPNLNISPNSFQQLPAGSTDFTSGRLA